MVIVWTSVGAVEMERRRRCESYWGMWVVGCEGQRRGRCSANSWLSHLSTGMCGRAFTQTGDTGRGMNWGVRVWVSLGQVDLEVLLHLTVTSGLPVHRSLSITVAIVMERSYLPGVERQKRATWWCSLSTAHPLWSLSKESTEDALFFILVEEEIQVSYFEEKGVGLLNIDMVFYLLFPFLPWRDLPLTLNLENELKQETNERARTLRTSMESEDWPEPSIGSDFSCLYSIIQPEGASFSSSNKSSILSVMSSLELPPPLPPLLRPFHLDMSLITFHSVLRRSPPLGGLCWCPWLGSVFIAQTAQYPLSPFFLCNTTSNF